MPCKESTTAPLMTPEEVEQISTACKILLLARTLGEHQLQGGVNQDAITEWLDLYASESTNPRRSLAMIKRCVKEFAPSRYLCVAIAEFDAEQKAAR